MRVKRKVTKMKSTKLINTVMILFGIFILFFLISPMHTYAAETTIVLKIGDPYMYVNSSTQEIDPGRGTAPLIVEERTLIPIRAVVEALNGTIGWDGAEQKIIIKNTDNTIILWIGEKRAVVNGIETETDVPPVIINDRTMLPTRFVLENLDCEVEWDGETKKVTIKKLTSKEMAVKKKVKEIIDELISPDMSEIEKELVLYEYVSNNSVYNENFENADSWSAYGVLINGVGVCTGFADTMKVLLNEAGIDCMTVGSTTTNHVWNIVKIDGIYYQLDATAGNEVTPNYYYWLNFSDEDITAPDPHDRKTTLHNNMNNRSSYPECNDNRYSFIRTAKSIVRLGEYFYHVNNRIETDNLRYRLYKTSLDGTETVRLIDSNVGCGICGYGEWIYYINENDGCKIYRFKTDGSVNEKFLDDTPKSFCMSCDSSGNLIYGSMSGEGGIYKINPDGTSKVKLSDDNPHVIRIRNDRIYYNTLLDIKSRITGVRQDGFKTTVNDDHSRILCIEDSWIYYINDYESDNRRLYRIRTDGSFRTKLNNEESLGGAAYYNFRLDNDRIYYSNCLDNGKIYSINIDGTGKTKLCDDEVLWYMDYYDGWVYYICHTDNMIYRVRTDGTDRTRLTDEESQMIFIYGDYIYYANSADNNSLYRMNPDGSEKTFINAVSGSKFKIFYENWIYDVDIFGQIFRHRLDGTDLQYLTCERSFIIDVKDSQIYYYNFLDGKLYSMDTDGNNITALNITISGDVYTVMPRMYGEWIYYHDYDYEKMYRMKTDGTQKELIN